MFKQHLSVIHLCIGRLLMWVGRHQAVSGFVFEYENIISVQKRSSEHHSVDFDMTCFCTDELSAVGINMTMNSLRELQVVSPPSVFFTWCSECVNNNPSYYLRHYLNLLYDKSTVLR